MRKQSLPHPLARRLINWLMEPLAAILLTVCATTAVAQPFYIPSGSMEPTLQIGDALLGTKFAYGYSRWSLPYGLGPASEKRLFGKLPARGDIVIFRKPGDTNTILIKRVIGLPGDVVSLTNGFVYIDGKRLNESWLPSSEQGVTVAGPAGNDSKSQLFKTAI